MNTIIKLNTEKNVIMIFAAPVNIPHTHTLAATLLLVRLFPVEGLVVFSTVGHSVAPRAGFVTGASAHPTKFNSRNGQHTLALLSIAGWFIL